MSDHSYQPLLRCEFCREETRHTFSALCPVGDADGQVSHYAERFECKECGEFRTWGTVSVFHTREAEYSAQYRARKAEEASARV